MRINPEHSVRGGQTENIPFVILLATYFGYCQI
jgi:hypothetical protein